MTISHDLNSNGYLINNEIWFNVKADAQILYFKFVFTNLSNSKITTAFINYVDQNNNVFVNIQPIVKALFDVPNGGTNNSTKIQISITANTGENLTLIKDFVRGGNRTNDTNQTISPNQSLRLYQTLPVWSGFPAYDYFLSPSYGISQQNLADVTNIDYRRIKGCNNIYLKFLNQKGGYSYWLFESFTEKEAGTPIGSTVGANNNLLDLGTLSNSDLKVYSKIPKEYKQYAFDLIVSLDLFAYQNGAWKKIFLKANSIERDNIKRVYSVSLNLDLNYRFNPTLLWSN